MKTLVLKFGGSSLENIESIQRRAIQIQQVKKEYERVLVIVSAMGPTTDDLLGMAHKISKSPKAREIDMLISAGERISMSLLSISLNELGVSAISFTGSQAGILTHDAHLDAEIIELKPTRVEEELNKGKVVVVAGFQGVNPQTKEITTLGRGGSDTTAVYFAHYFQAEACYLLKDVPGIFSSDPKLDTQAELLKHISYGKMIELCQKGAQVLHLKAVRAAQQFQMPLRVALADDFQQYTEISG